MAGNATCRACAIVCLLTLAASAADPADLPREFLPVRPVVVPHVAGSDWPRSTIDSFIEARLAERGLAPTADAERRTWLRRASFDLIGLPPTPDEVDAFLADEAPDAAERTIDRWLASPRYGERWGRHWLDVVRYADARDLIQLPAESDFREAWRYRDWVVDVFNRDLPYDEFVRRQVAGDLLQPPDDDRIDAEALVATGMLAIADFVPGDVDKEQMIADYVHDQIDVVGRAILGLTIGCARCHDHKFDPITTEDYYALAGIFFSSRIIPGPIKGNTPLVRAPLASRRELAELEAEKQRDAARRAELAREIEQFGRREYLDYLARRAEVDSERYLTAAWEWTQFIATRPADKPAEELAPFAAARQLETNTLARWARYVSGPTAHPALKRVAAATNLEEARGASRETTRRLTATVANRRQRENDDATSRTLALNELLGLRVDERSLDVDAKRRATFAANRGRAAADFSPVADAEPPELAAATFGESSRGVLRFAGNELLQAATSVPAQGTLFVVFRPDPRGPGGQRLIGWEDASAGRHGVGLMVDSLGAVHAILRRDGANGDVVAPAPPRPAIAEPNGAQPNEAPRDFQLLAVTWGPGGVSLHRNGQLAGKNTSIDSVSSDPTITALRIGGPGSGASPRFQGELAELRVFGTALDDAARARVESELRRRWRPEPTDRVEPQATDDAYAELAEDLTSGASPFRLATEDRERALPAELRERRAALRAEFELLKKKTPREVARAVVIQEGGPADTPHAGFHDAHVFVRGNPRSLGKVVPRGVPKALAGPTPPVIGAGSGRRELARWLTEPHNPLTARVIVNRLWQHHFGTGIVRTSTNFGAMGDAATHPELLDHLAGQFMAHDWSMKSLQRQIVASRVYAQSSSAPAAALQADPDNRWYGRMNRRKLEAEPLRDALLAVAGRLDLRAGGPPLAEMTTPRRTLYLQASRTGAKTAEFGGLFDAADCTGIVERRTESIVAPQSLFLLNDPWMSELARELAERVARDVPDGRPLDRPIDDVARRGHERRRIARLYAVVLGREPTEEEVLVGRELLADRSLSNPWISYCRVLLCANEFLFVD